MPVFEIPYLAQSSTSHERTCGAAALAMVYASLGIHQPQHEIWRSVAQANEQGSPTAHSYRLAGHALEQGLAAVAVQAARPWETLHRCWDTGVRVIVNHRVRAESRLGHYSVLAGIEAEEVLLHDPQAGPSQRIEREAFLRLWLPVAGGSEIAGCVLVAVGRREEDEARCGTCATLLPESVECAGCGRVVWLRPAGAMGCAQSGCDGRLWKYVFCAQCDRAVGPVVQRE